MRPQLLGVAAAVAAFAFSAAPASAEPSSAAYAGFGSSQAFEAIPPVRVHRGNGGFRHDGGNHRRHRRDRDAILIGDGYGWDNGQWALYNNRTFDSDSYNDWWHDQPSRAYPRWMSQNLGCDKPWYSGDVLRC